MELATNVMSADIRSGGVQTCVKCVPHFVTISYDFDVALYFGGTGKSAHRCRLGFLSPPHIVVVIVAKVMWLLFMNLSGDYCVCFHG